ncbi:ABC transporter permease [Streptomyces sp. SHP22-7]|nr:ABC transporter permease [Streptomyces sp. SHP22-7]
MINAFTAIAVVNTLGTATAGRRREFALLRLAGAQSSQVLRMLVWEAVLTCVIALSLAAVVCAAVLTTLSTALTGSAVPALAAGSLTVLVVAAFLVTVATVTLVGRTVMRRTAAAPGAGRRPSLDPWARGPAAAVTGGGTGVRRDARAHGDRCAGRVGTGVRDAWGPVCGTRGDRCAGRGAQGVGRAGPGGRGAGPGHRRPDSCRRTVPDEAGTGAAAPAGPVPRRAASRRCGSRPRRPGRC